MIHGFAVIRKVRPLVCKGNIVFHDSIFCLNYYELSNGYRFVVRKYNFMLYKTNSIDNDSCKYLYLIIWP